MNSTHLCEDMAHRDPSHPQTSTTMSTEKSAISSSWNVSRVRSGLLNSSSGQDARPLLQAFLKLKSHILVIRQLAAGEQAKLLEIIDQVSAIAVTEIFPKTDCRG